MLKNPASALITTLNVHWTHLIDEPTLRNVIISQLPPDIYFGQLHQLYSEVPASMVIQWATTHHISVQSLMEYYDRYLSQTQDLNPALQKWLSGNLENPI